MKSNIALCAAESWPEIKRMLDLLLGGESIMSKLIDAKALIEKLQDEGADVTADYC